MGTNLNAVTVSVPADDTIVDLSKRLGEARRYKKEWGDVEGVLKEEIEGRVEEIAVANGVEATDVTAIVASGTTKVLGVTEYFTTQMDWASFKADYPDLPYDKYEKKNLVRQLRPAKLS